MVLIFKDADVEVATSEWTVVAAAGGNIRVSYVEQEHGVDCARLGHVTMRFGDFMARLQSASMAGSAYLDLREGG